MNLENKVIIRLGGKQYSVSPGIRAELKADWAASAALPLEARRIRLGAVLKRLVDAGQAVPVLHKFEERGLGKAPFAYAGMSENWYVAHQGAQKQPGGSCDYCGMGIAYEFHVRSADGRLFKVGCDCIAKVGDEGLRRAIAADERKLLNARNEAARVRRNSRKIEAQVAAYAQLETWRRDAALSSFLVRQAHPAGRENSSALSYLDWCLENLGGSNAASAVRRLSGVVAAYKLAVNQAGSVPSDQEKV
jgi:hypothetical protein